MRPKITDDYSAKFKIWAQERRVVPTPKPVNLPHFKGQKFNTIEEYERWRREYLALIARHGGLRWTK